MPSYEVGDLVWAKVKSHPWWPGQIFNAAYASDQAKSLEKPGRSLVAFYGDHTFAWLQNCQILEFKPNFEEKAKVTKTENFQDAISEALDEVCKRAYLGLQCQCRKSLLDELTFNDDDGVKGTREGLRSHKDMSTSRETLNARRTLSFLKDLASSPCNPSSSSVDASVLHGHALGIRRGIFADTSKDETLEEGVFASTGKGKTLEEGVFAHRGRVAIGTIEVQSQVKCKKRGIAGYNKDIFSLEDCKRAKRCHVGGLEVDNEDKERASTDRGSYVHTENEISSFCDDKANHFLMQISEALQFVAIDPLCHHVSYNTMVTEMAVFLKFRDLVFQKSAGYGYHLQTPSQNEMQLKDAPHVGTTDGEHDSPNVVAKAVRYWRPTSQKQRTSDPAHDNQLEKLETLNSTRAQPNLQCVEPMKVCHEGKKLSSDQEGPKTDVVLGSSFEGVSQAHSSARKIVLSQKLDVHELLIEAHKKMSDITKEAPAKLDVHELLIEAHKSNSDFTKEAPSKLDAQELLLEAQKSECTKEVPVKDLKKALKTAGDIFSEVHSDVRMDAKQHLETRSLKGFVEFSEGASKMSAFEGEVFSESNADNKVCADHFSEETPGFGDTVERKSTTKACKHAFHRVSCDNENMENSSQICDKRASSTQHDDGASSQLPVGLFMKFPSGFSLPLETQLNAMFVAFGALEAAGTRVFRDTASAQVIFKHGNEAEAAYKCVKEVSPFGKASVAFRLQHFVHPLSVKDNPQHSVAAAS